MTNIGLVCLRTLQPKIREAMGELQNHDLLWCRKHGRFWIYPYETGWHYDCCDRIPLPVPMPGVDPKRTLWGMIKGRVTLRDRSVVANDARREYECLSSELVGSFTADTLYLALLKCLAHQSDVEVKE